MEKKLKIIVVEDSENDTILEIRLIEQAGYKVKYVRVETKEELEAALKVDEWDVVLSDFTMPRFSGAEALKVVRSKDDFIPFIFVSGTIGEDRAVKTLKDGASDYILKIDPKRLVSSIERELRDKELRLQRIRAQDELRESEERYRDLFDSAPVGYHEIDGDGLIVKVNRCELQLFGYELHEMVGKPVWFFVTDPDSVKERLKGKLAGRVPVSVNFDRIYVRKDGTTFPAIIDESYIRDKMGKVVGIRTVVQDVTEKRLTEERLRLATFVIENSPSILFRCLPETGWPILYVSDNVAAWGYDLSTLGSGAFHFADLVYPADMGRLQQVMEQNAVEKRDRFSVDFRVLKGDGGPIWVSAHCFVERDTAGNVINIQGIVTDISERKRSEESLKFFRDLMDQSYDSVEVADAETGRFIDCNERAWSSLGYTREEFLSLTISDVDPLFPPSALAEAIAKLRKSGGMAFEGIHKRKDGTTLPVEVNSKFVQLDRNYLVGITRDISERKRAEETIRQQAEQYTAMLATATDGFARLDENGKFLEVSDAFSRMTGYNTEELLMLGMPDIETAAKPEETALRIEKVMKAGFDRSETRFRRKDGTIIDVEISVTILRQRGQVLMFSRDITRSRRAEQDLRLFRQLVDHSNDGVQVIDPETGMFLDVNEKACQQLGYSRDELLGMKIFDIDTELDSQKYSMVTRLLEESKSTLIETVYRRKDGSTFPVEVNVSSVKMDKMYGVTIVRDITERRHAEENVRLEAEKYNVMLETTTDGFARLDRSGKFLEINDAFCTTSGYSREELLNLRISDIEAAEKPEETARRMEKVVKSGFDRFVSQHRRKDGTIIDVEISVTHWQRAGQFLMFSRDITRSKRTDERLRLLAHTITSVSDCVTVTDTEGVIVFVNKAFLKTYGYSESGVIGKHIDFVRSPLNDPALGAAIKSGTLAGGWQGELLNRRKDGTEFPVHLSSSVVRNERGDVIAMVGVARDITERRQAEEELRLFRQLVDHSNDAFEVIEPETGRFLDVNQKACTDLGYTRDELLRMTVFDIDPGLNREEFNAAGAASGESIPPVLETLHRRKDGSTFPVEVSIGAVKLEHPYFVAITRNITERKALEEQYRRTQRMDMLGTLASGIAHDLNNVLTPIALAIEMLQRKYGSDEKTARLLSTLELMVNRGSGAVKQILALARGAESRLERLDPVNVVEDVRRMMEQTFPKNISHAATVEKGTGLLLGDRTQIYQILVNLCINARDAMQDGGRLSLSARNAAVDEQYAGMTRGAKAGKYILFEVRDTGTGFMKEDMGKSFDPFFTITEAGKGAGLGLAIAHGLVESHGGFIEVDSEVHKGTVFRVYLPAAATGEQIPQPAPEPTPGLGHGELILIADDEMAIREITKSTLEAYGYKVLVASDGSEAVSLYAGQRDEISLVVTDMAMPIMDGSATVSALRKINPGVRVIVATGYMDSSDTLRISGTANAILKKPYSAAGLMKVITEVLSTADSEV